MSGVTITKDTVFVRAMDVATRVTEQVTEMVANAEGGALVETMLGRYVLDRDARAIWVLLDGRRSVGQIAGHLAATTGLPPEELVEPVRDLCARLGELRLAELAGSAQR
jgi:hypothetical protein